MKTLLSIIVIVAIGFVMIVPSVFADSVTNTEQWHKHYTLGKFINSNPPKPDQIFIFQYRAINGTVSEFTSGSGGFSARVHSTSNTSLDFKIPRNYPYTNQPENGPTYGDTSPLVLMDTPPVDAVAADYAKSKLLKPVPETTNCFFVYSIPFSGDHKVDFILSYLLSGGFPYHGDAIPQSCGSQTIAEHLSPLKQIEMGVEPKYVKCDTGFYTILHPDKKTISCVKSKTGEKLIERGWAKAVSWYSDENDEKINPLGILALVIYSPPDACLGPCPPNNFYLKINSASPAYLLGYNICDGNSCTKRNDLSVLLPIKDILTPNFERLGLPENLQWKYGDTVRIQLIVSPTADNKTASLLDLGNSTIVH